MVADEEDRTDMISADAIRGYIDLMVLSILAERPSYPYELVRTITEASGGDYPIKQTTLYSAVKRLESAGMITAHAERSPTGKPRTYYRLTDAGRELHLAKLAEWRQTRSIVDRFTRGDF